jgi:hypothetical protein
LSQTRPITPPTFAPRSAAVPHPPNPLPPRRAQNAPSPSPSASMYAHPEPRAPTFLGLCSSGSTAPTVLDKLPRSPDLTRALPPMARSTQPSRPLALPVASRMAPPIAPRPVQPTVPCSVPLAAPRTAPRIASRLVQPAAPRTTPLAVPRSAPPVASHLVQPAAPRSALPATSRSAPPAAPRPVQPLVPHRAQATSLRSAQPAASQSAQPAVPRTTEASNRNRAAARLTLNEDGVDVPPGNVRSAPTPETAQSRFDMNLGGPAPGLPPRVRPYVPYTDLIHDRAEEFAAANTRASGRRAVST